MPLYTPTGTTSYPEFTDLADRVTNGDGLGWPGDPRLWLGIGVAVHPRTGKQGHRLEVWRSCEDGTDQMLGSWHPSEQFKVCFDLARMRLDAPGHESVEDRIDRDNAAREAKGDEVMRDLLTQRVERMAYQLMRKQGNARNRFSVPTNPLAT
jgi:hypothetical protein